MSDQEQGEWQLLAEEALTNIVLLGSPPQAEGAIRIDGLCGSDGVDPRLVCIRSMGLRSLVVARKRMRARQGRTVLVDIPPAVQTVFDTVAAVDVGPLFASTAELDAYHDFVQSRSTASLSDAPEPA